MENKKDSSTVSNQTQSGAQTVTTKSAFQTNAQPNPVMQSFSSPQTGPSALKVLFVLLVMAAFGIGTGYGLAIATSRPGSPLTQALNPNAPQKGQTYGTGDIKSFKDTAEGTLKEGGIDGEGQYHLERPGGDSQNVYLTSSSVDLSTFMGKKIKVWGATQTAQKAGWLMDVGKVQVQ